MNHALHHTTALARFEELGRPRRSTPTIDRASRGRLRRMLRGA